ncbi:hypothetical protein IV102_21320 [bacterium]|nr:hypothetical protein [bacterium]
MRQAALLLWLLAGCARSPLPEVAETPVPTQQRALFWAQLATTATAPEPFPEALFYYGDTHFHSGFSGDNPHDQEPLQAYRSACERTPQLALRYGPRLGGFFLFLSDHITYIKTRADMDESRFQIMRRQADDPSVDRSGPGFTFTAFAGAELTGLGRAGHPEWDDKFGHLNLFLTDSVADFVENDVSSNWGGTQAMDKFSANPEHLGQFNHPGYGNEPRTGDDADHLYPYSPARDRVFRLIEVNDDRPAHWETGIAQYNVCLRQGYHVSPVVGTDIHNTKSGLTGQARTVVVMPSTLGLTLWERRAMLVHYLRLGRVFATESPTVEITWSLNGYPMGSIMQRPQQPSSLQLSVSCNNSHVARVELVGGIDSQMPAAKIDQESQCTAILYRWEPQRADFSSVQQLANKDLDKCAYVYLKVTLASGQRAVTAPIYLESEPVK